MISVNPPSGFRDFIHDEARRRLSLMHTISSVYQSFGFSPIETPVLENLEVLQGGGGGEENEKLIFKIMKRGERLTHALQNQPSEDQIAEFGLRFDLTLPLSRLVAAHRSEIQYPWKVFHIGPVWRAERPQKGRFREFVQCDVDIVGAKAIGAEIEVIQAATAALKALGATGFQLRINDRRLIQAMAEKMGLGGSRLNAFAVLLDKKDKLDRDALLQQMQALLGSQDLSADLVKWLEGESSLSSVESFHPEAVRDLTLICETLRSLQLSLEDIVFDPSLVRGMGYYTGPVFELRHASAGYSFGGGGRYNHLIGRFSGQEIPACGMSLGFERLCLLLSELEKNAKEPARTIFFPVFQESLRPAVLQLASQVRDSGLPVDVYPEAAKVKNQFKFASDRGYRWVVILGEEECQAKLCKLKDFETTQEISIPQSQLVSELQRKGT